MLGKIVVTRALMLLQQATPAALEPARNNPPWGHYAEDIIIPLIIFVFIAVVVWLGTRAKQAKLRAQLELQKNVLDKFGSGQEFAAFLESENGQKFLAGLWSPISSVKQGAQSARHRLVKSISIGVILLTLGLGFMALSFFAQHLSELIVPGVILLALGVGSLVAAWISHRLSLRWSKDEQPGATAP